MMRREDAGGVAAAEEVEVIEMPEKEGDFERWLIVRAGPGAPPPAVA
jgi:hypothetical protein